MSISAYLTLGSNLGARAANVQASLSAIRQRCGQVISTSFMYETAPQLIQDQPNYINAACHIRTDLSPAQLLQVVKSIESDLGRDQHGLRYGPRVIDIDLALYGNEIVDIDNGELGLQIPHLRLSERDFVLQPLCDIDPDLYVPNNTSMSGQLDATLANLLETLRKKSVNDSSSGTGLLQRVMPVNTCAGEERLWAWGSGSTKTLVMGILNATPDSFSDGGRVHSEDGHVDIQRALAAAHKMMEDGANVIDVGGESTRPNADFVSPEQEINRVVPLIEAIKSNLPDAVVSVDTRRADVAELALKAGASIVNDVSGGTHDVSMRDLVSREACPYIVMHMKGNPKTMNSLASYSDSDSSATSRPNRNDSGVVQHVKQSLSTLTQDAQDAGVSRWNLMVDPGLGFAKETRHNLELLRSLPQLSEFPILVGASRKRFIAEILPHRESNAMSRDWGTAATTAAAVAGYAAAVRVHNVEANVDVARVADAVWKAF